MPKLSISPAFIKKTLKMLVTSAVVIAVKGFHLRPDFGYMD